MAKQAEENEGKKKTAWNITGGVIGALLAALSMFGIVASQSSVKQPQTAQEVISYNS